MDDDDIDVEALMKKIDDDHAREKEAKKERASQIEEDKAGTVDDKEEEKIVKYF